MLPLEIENVSSSFPKLNSNSSWSAKNQLGINGPVLNVGSRGRQTLSSQASCIIFFFPRQWFTGSVNSPCNQTQSMCPENMFEKENTVAALVVLTLVILFLIFFWVKDQFILHLTCLSVYVLIAKSGLWSPNSGPVNSWLLQDLVCDIILSESDSATTSTFYLCKYTYFIFS